MRLLTHSTLNIPCRLCVSQTIEIHILSRKRAMMRTNRPLTVRQICVCVPCSKTVSAGALQHYAMNGQPETVNGGMQAAPPGRGIPSQPQRSAPQAPAAAQPQRSAVQGQPAVRGGSAPPPQQQSRAPQPPPPQQNRAPQPPQNRAGPQPPGSQQRPAANDVSVSLCCLLLLSNLHTCSVTVLVQYRNNGIQMFIKLLCSYHQ